MLYTFQRFFTSEGYPHILEPYLRNLVFHRTAVAAGNAPSVGSIAYILSKSNIWISLPGFTSQTPNNDSNVLTPQLKPGEVPLQLFARERVKFLNKDVLEQELPHLHPVSQPHDIATQKPIFNVELQQNLTKARLSHQFVSNWWIPSHRCAKLGLLVKSGKYPIFVVKNGRFTVCHVSQLTNGEAFLQIPFSINGHAYCAELAEPLYAALCSRSVSSGLFLSPSTISRLQLRIAAGARGVSVPNTSMNARATELVTHYYNIHDVKLPPSYVAPEQLPKLEQEHPGVPFDGITAQQLDVNALINLPNITRHVWFSAMDLVKLGARCGINAVPVVVVAKANEHHTFYHVEDVVEEDRPKAFAAVHHPELCLNSIS